MTVERGVRRALVVLSVLVTAGCAVFVSNHAAENRWSYLAHHTTVEAYCDPARRSVYEVQQLPEEAVQVDGFSVPGCTLPPERAPQRLTSPKTDREVIERIDRYLNQLAKVPTVTILRAEHRWFREYLVPIAGYTLAFSGASLAVLWASFFAVCWIISGFRGGRPCSH
jgi:hypothetical protein